MATGAGGPRGGDRGLIDGQWIGELKQQGLDVVIGAHGHGPVPGRPGVVASISAGALHQQFRTRWEIEEAFMALTRYWNIDDPG